MHRKLNSCHLLPPQQTTETPTTTKLLLLYHTLLSSVWREWGQWGRSMPIKMLSIEREGRGNGERWRAVILTQTGTRATG